MQSIIAKQTESRVKEIARYRKYEYKVNKNVSFGSLKDRVVLLFRMEDCRSVLTELEKLFMNSPVPIIPGRKFPRKSKRVYKGKYYTFKNHKRPA